MRAGRRNFNRFERFQPCAATTVQEALQESKKWPHSTVRTLMDRMARKGFLKTERIRNLTLYRAAITSDQPQKGELAELEQLIKEKRQETKS
jgi:predicted transcriptional regulator